MTKYENLTPRKVSKLCFRLVEIGTHITGLAEYCGPGYRTEIEKLQTEAYDITRALRALAS